MYRQGFPFKNYEHDDSLWHCERRKRYYKPVEGISKPMVDNSSSEENKRLKNEITKKQEELDTLIKERDEYKDKYLHLSADFDNYRKNKEKEILRTKDIANKKVVIDLTEIVEDIVRGYRQSSDSEGLNLIYTKIINVMKANGAESYGKVGVIFDPDEHEAVGTTHEGNVRPGYVSHIVSDGWKINGEIVKFARVMVENDNN